MIQIKYIFIFILSIISIAGKGQNRITYIKMEQFPCATQICPAYIIEIKNNGVVHFQGIENALFDGSIEGKLPMNDFLALVKKYQSYPFLTLSDSYTHSNEETHQVAITLKVNGITKNINNATDGPEYLTSLRNDISSLLGKKIVWNKKTFKPNVRFTPPVLSIEENLDPPLQEAVDDLKLMEPDLVLQVADQMPEFPGGQSNINAFLMKHIQYPTQAREMGIQGKVICRFVVNSDGLITNLTTINSIGGGCEQEALRVLKMMPKWNPGKHQGKAVNIQMQLPILFKLK